MNWTGTKPPVESTIRIGSLPVGCSMSPDPPPPSLAGGELPGDPPAGAAQAARRMSTAK